MADICGGSLGWGRETTVGLLTTAIFSVFVGCFFENFTDKASIIIQRRGTQSFVGFSVIQKCMTLNGYLAFRVKFCFRSGLPGSDGATFQKITA